jgi:hypothetical protein
MIASGFMWDSPGTIVVKLLLQIETAARALNEGDGAALRTAHGPEIGA